MNEFEQIVANLQEGINDPGIFKAIFMAGGPGSGKSTVAKKLGLFALGLRPINSDSFFEMALKKAGMSLKLGTLDPEVIDSMRVSAKRLGGKQLGVALNGRLGLVIDSTARNTEKLIKVKKDLEILGYDTAMVFVDTSLETALERNEMRARSVPENVVRNSHAQIRANVKKLESIFGKQNFFNISNDGDMRALDKETNKWFPKIKNWVNKKPKSPIAKEWMKQFEELDIDMQRALIGPVNEIDRRPPAKRDMSRMQAGMKSHEKKLFKRMIAQPKLAVKELQVTIDLFKKQLPKATGLTQPIIKAQMDKYMGWLEQLQQVSKMQTEAKFKPDRHLQKMMTKMTDKELKKALKDQHKTELPMKLIMHIKHEMKARGLKEAVTPAPESPAPASDTTTASIPKHVGIEPDGKFGGSPVFNCDNGTFSNCIKGKKKYGRWSVYLGKDNPFYKKMQNWMGQSYKNKNFILRNDKTGEMTFARRVNEELEQQLKETASRDEWNAVNTLLGARPFKFTSDVMKKIGKMKRTIYKDIPNPGSHFKSLQITNVRVADPDDPIGSHTAIDFKMEWTGATSLGQTETFSVSIEEDASNPKVVIYSMLSKGGRGTYRMSNRDKPAMVVSSLIQRWYENVILRKVNDDIQGFKKHLKTNPPRQPLPGAGRR